MREKAKKEEADAKEVQRAQKEAEKRAAEELKI